jgi:hypothetical protein
LAGWPERYPGRGQLSGVRAKIGHGQVALEPKATPAAVERAIEPHDHGVGGRLLGDDGDGVSLAGSPRMSPLP